MTTALTFPNWTQRINIAGQDMATFLLRTASALSMGAACVIGIWLSSANLGGPPVPHEYRWAAVGAACIAASVLLAVAAHVMSRDPLWSEPMRNRFEVLTRKKK